MLPYHIAAVVDVFFTSGLAHPAASFSFRQQPWTNTSHPWQHGAKLTLEAINANTNTSNELNQTHLVQ